LGGGEYISWGSSGDGSLRGKAGHPISQTLLVLPGKEKSLKVKKTKRVCNEFAEKRGFSDNRYQDGEKGAYLSRLAPGVVEKNKGPREGKNLGEEATGKQRGSC